MKLSPRKPSISRMKMPNAERAVKAEDDRVEQADEVQLEVKSLRLKRRKVWLKVKETADKEAAKAVRGRGRGRGQGRGGRGVQDA